MFFDLNIKGSSLENNIKLAMRLLNMDGSILIFHIIKMILKML